jgi:hypothetical protein
MTEENIETTGRTDTQDPKQKIKQLLEGNRNLAQAEIKEILVKYDCTLSATMTVTSQGCYPNIIILNNNQE